jgi:catechol 2,3-dioxygenase-like lactoylglutathione lyase family enzyme
MFDHVTIRASDRAASEAFYDLVLHVVGREKSHSGAEFAEWDDFSLAAATAAKPVTRRLHIAFFAPTQDEVDEFWRVGTEAGYDEDGAPGMRPEYSDDYYGAFLLDPDGNSVEAVSHNREVERGAIDHIWMRVADLSAAQAFYEQVAPFTGFRLQETGHPERRRFRAPSDASFSIVAGEPTEELHLAFPASTNEAVDDFHRVALASGYSDIGAPGERAVYHAGYYGAFVLDPDGNNVEVVNHNR